MTALELIEQTGGINNYCKVLSEWSMVIIKAKRGKLSTPRQCKMFASITLEDYIMNHSQYKAKKQYKPRANEALPQVTRNKAAHMRRLAKGGYYASEINSYILETPIRDLMLSDVWSATNSRAKYDTGTRSSESAIGAMD